MGNGLCTDAAYAYALLNLSMDFSSQTYVNDSAESFDNYSVVFISDFVGGGCHTLSLCFVRVSVYLSFNCLFLPLCLLQDYQEKISALEGTIQQLQEETGLRGRLSEETQDALKRYVPHVCTYNLCNHCAWYKCLCTYVCGPSLLPTLRRQGCQYK